MIIDSHQHFWKYDPERHSWITEDMKVLRKDFLPADLEPILKQHKIDGCIAVQADMSEGETDFLIRCAEEYPFIKGVVGWVDLLDANVSERLEHYGASAHLVGIRHIVQDEPDNQFMLRSDFMNGIAKLDGYNLTYDILVYPHQLASAILLARKFPNQRFILDHLAKPRISEGLDAIWKSEIISLAKCANVSCKISGMVTETRKFNWQEDDFTPFMEVVVNAFGTDRILYGSDWPVCLLAADYTDVLHIVRKYLEPFSATEKERIMGLNTVKWYGLAK